MLLSVRSYPFLRYRTCVSGDRLSDTRQTSKKRRRGRQQRSHHHQLFLESFHQCSGTVTFWNRSGFGSCSFWQWLSECQQKIEFFPSFFFLCLNVGTLTSVSKDNMSLRTQLTKQYRKKSWCILIFLLVDGMIRIRRNTGFHVTKRRWKLIILQHQTSI